MLSKLLTLVAVSAAASTIAACGSSSGSTRSHSASATTAEALNGKGSTFLMLTQGSSDALTHSIANTVGKAFAAKFDFKLAFDTSCCGIEKLKAMASDGNMTYSVVQLATYADQLAAEKAGLLLPLNPKIIPLSSLRPGSYDRYGFDLLNFAPVVAWTRKGYPPGTPHPTAFEDAFNATKFPGKRCIYKGPEIGGTYEGALLAAGVPVSQLYPIDYAKAVAQLSRIKNDTVWWSDGAQAVQLLESGACKIAVLWNGLAQTANLSGANVAVAWKDAPISPEWVAIPKGSPNADAAQYFLAEFLKDRMAETQLLAQTAYPPSFKSFPLPASIQQWAPVGPNYDAGFLQNQQWYIANLAEATQKLNDFIVTGNG